MSDDFEYAPRARPARPVQPPGAFRLGCVVFVAVLAAILCGACIIASFAPAEFEYVVNTVSPESVELAITLRKSGGWTLVKSQAVGRNVELTFRRRKAR